jgi:ATP-binding cassette subfamily B protein
MPGDGKIGYVPQGNHLISCIRPENLMLAMPEATTAEVELAAKRAHAHDFISALPRGTTIIGDQGVLLSGGNGSGSRSRALLMNQLCC